MFSEKQISLLENMKVPSTYWTNKSAEYRYFFRSLLQKIDSSLVFSGLPEEWNQDFFLWCLWAFGYVVVFDTERWGTTFQPATLSGQGWYYEPTKALIANPLYNKELTIGKDCELLKLTPDYRGVLDIIDHYAGQLAEATKGIDIGLINAKFPLVLSANNESQAETLKKVYDKVQAGESLVIWKDQTDHFNEVIPRKDPFETWNNDFKQTYIVSNLLDDLHTIMDDFYTEIGIPVSVVDKKAHMLDAEADFQQTQSQARISCWVANLEESFKKINKHYNLGLEVDYARTYDDGGDGKYPQQDK